MLKTLKTIILSRLTKPKENKEVLRKRKICKDCDYNSSNMINIPLKKQIFKKLSDYFSLIAGKKEEDNLSNCEACLSCSIFYKTIYEEDCPHPQGDKWKLNKKYKNENNNFNGY
jgi:hypothetical protein